MSQQGWSFQRARRYCCVWLLRDINGKWIRGFPRNLGRGSVFVAKLWGGGSRAQACSSERDGNKVGSFVGWRLVSQICHLMTSIPRIRLVLIFREGNGCADVLADYACGMEEGYYFFLATTLYVVAVYFL